MPARFQGGKWELQPRNAQGKIIPQGFQQRPDNEQQESKIADDAVGFHSQF